MIENAIENEQMARPAGVCELPHFKGLVWLAVLKIARRYGWTRASLASKKGDPMVEIEPPSTTR